MVLPDEDEKTYPCKFCSRQFVQRSLIKHEAICKKMLKSNRKVFDSGKQRATGSDISLKDVRKAQVEREKLGGTFPRPKTSWRERHETFVSAVSSSKQVDYALKTGTPLPPPPNASSPKGYVRCKYCERSFNEGAAERHIPFCKEQYERKKTIKAVQPPKVTESSAKRMTSVPKSSSMKRINDLYEGNLPTDMRNNMSRTSNLPLNNTMKSKVNRSPSNKSSVERGMRSNLGNSVKSSIPTPVRRSNSAPRSEASTSTSRRNLKMPMENEYNTDSLKEMLRSKPNRMSRSKRPPSKKR